MSSAECGRVTVIYDSGCVSSARDERVCIPVAGDRVCIQADLWGEETIGCLATVVTIDRDTVGLNIDRLGAATFYTKASNVSIVKALTGTQALEVRFPDIRPPWLRETREDIERAEVSRRRIARIMLAKSLFRTDPEALALVARVSDQAPEGDDRWERAMQTAWDRETAWRERSLARAEVMAEWLGSAVP